MKGILQMKKQQQILIDRIDELCKEKDYTYYVLSYKSSVPMTTLMHIMKGESKNPGIFTILKICDGLDVTIQEFFGTKEFEDVKKE